MSGGRRARLMRSLERANAQVLYCMLRAFTPEEGGDGAGSG